MTCVVQMLTDVYRKSIMRSMSFVGKITEQRLEKC